MDDDELEAQMAIEREMEEVELAERQLEPLPPPPPPAPSPEGEPETDMDAMRLLHSVAGREWMSFGGKTLFVYGGGIWHTQAVNGLCPCFQALVSQHEARLGKKYGKSLHGIQTMQKLALGVNRCPKRVTETFDQLPAGVIPFSDGLYDVERRTLRAFRHEDLLTCKFDFPAPRPDDDVEAERAHVLSIFGDLLPDEQLKCEVLSRVAESLFSPVNTHKIFVQLYGKGNNGKTTLMRMLATALPEWVQMPNAEHLSEQSASRDPSAAKPWLMNVMGTRLLGFEEPPSNKRFDGNLLKLLRGNGVVTGRKLYGDDVSYVPTFTMWFCTNHPIQIAPADPAVLNSLTSFEMPAYFKGPGDTPPLGTKFVKEKVPGIESLFKQRRYKLALIEVMREYWVQYCRNGKQLPALQSKWSAPWSQLYQESNPTDDDLFNQCILVELGARTSQRLLFSAMQGQGYKDTDIAFSHFLRTKFMDHAFVFQKRAKLGMVWQGLRLADAGGDYF
jgi:hypothetical protein